MTGTKTAALDWTAVEREFLEHGNPLPARFSLRICPSPIQTSANDWLFLGRTFKAHALADLERKLEQYGIQPITTPGASHWLYGAPRESRIASIVGHDTRDGASVYWCFTRK